MFPGPVFAALPPLLADMLCARQGVGNSKQEASVAGSVAAAHYIRAIAPTYGKKLHPMNHGRHL